MNIAKISTLVLTALVSQQGYATEGTVLESAYDRAEKAYHSKEWKELPDEALVRSNRIKWNRVAKAALNLPEWMEFSLSQRTRYENVSNNWRKNERAANNSQLPLQSRVHLGANYGPFWLMFEGQDSRTHFNEPGDFTGRMINEFDILQLFGSATFKNVFDTGLRTDFHFGRITLELANARLIGRNDFPNTTNAFDGGHFALGNDKDWRVRTFLTAPVAIDEIRLDKSSEKNLFWGAAFESKQLQWLSGEAYYLGISESKNPARSRHFSTFGVHAYKKAVKKKSHFKDHEFGRWDYDLETMIQTGKRRNKDHFAYASFAHIGYTLNAPWIPQFQAEYFYASGSEDPSSGKSQTFDKLFGLRRGDFMQTSLYGPFGHSNLESVGWRFAVKPTDNSMVYFKHHANWLAEAKDIFDGSQVSGGNLQDKTGNSGRWLGNDIELAGEYKLGSNLILSAGYSHWFKGDYFDKLAATAGSGIPQNGEKDTDYFFFQTELRL
ncbi:MAG: alginate export family protein [Methyloprofundus sp.]|nr:alginate export family protein [Methyloprofundus sp.]MBW6453466.1 alginate export family protein [Methyloprofundus sp.]